MKKVLIAIFSVAIVGVIAYKLYTNKEEMKEEAKLAEVTSDAIPVKLTALQQKSLATAVSADGTFEAATDLTILSETSGKLIKVYQEKGATVKKGELLAQVENEILQTQVAAAEISLEKYKTDEARFSKLLAEDAITKRQFEDIKTGLKNAEAQYKSSKKQLDNTYIRATAGGYINDDFVQEGEFISGGSKLYNIVNIATLKLNVKLTANEVLQVKVGDEVEVTTSVYPKATFYATVKSIAAKADPSLKYNVELTLTNPEEKSLKPGMYASAHFDFQSGTQSTYLDRNALIGSIQKPEVYIVENNVAKLKSIKIGETYGDLVEVLSGISTKDKVVLSGQINLAEGTKVKVLN